MAREREEKTTISKTPTGWWLRTLASFAAVAVLQLAPGAATQAQAEQGQETCGQLTAEWGLGMSAFVASLVYSPVKVLYATGGLLVGGASWIVSGGNEGAARGVIRPAVKGDYVVTPDHLRGRDPLEFVAR